MASTLSLPNATIVALSRAHFLKRACVFGLMCAALTASSMILTKVSRSIFLTEYIRCSFIGGLDAPEAEIGVVHRHEPRPHALFAVERVRGVAVAAVVGGTDQRQVATRHDLLAVDVRLHPAVDSELLMDQPVDPLAAHLADGDAPIPGFPVGGHDSERRLGVGGALDDLDRGGACTRERRAVDGTE